MSEENLSDRLVAVVTGGSRGIGRAVVQRLARANVEVHFTYLTGEQAARELESALLSEGKSARGKPADARDLAAVSSMVRQVIDERGRLDLLINNAAVTRDRLLARMRDDEWLTVLETSLNGMFGASREASRQMMRQRTGRIVNLTSVSGVVGIAGQTNYSAAKAAIIGFTRSLAKELAPSGVSVNAVAPGFIDTDMLAHFSAEQRQAAVQRVPMKRLGEADEVANLVSYLCLEAPSYLTGQTLIIDGGMTS